MLNETINPWNHTFTEVSDPYTPNYNWEVPDGLTIEESEVPSGNDISWRQVIVEAYRFAKEADRALKRGNFDRKD
ncbi:hypothetical protein GF389_05010 [Candidatus Dojkabacteria bacterium]|nr:hypothetical protein [Candidatus Dojkabacteria bacterium]